MASGWHRGSFEVEVVWWFPSHPYTTASVTTGWWRIQNTAKRDASQLNEFNVLDEEGRVLIHAVCQEIPQEEWQVLPHTCDGRGSDLSGCWSPLLTRQWAHVIQGPCCYLACLCLRVTSLIHISLDARIRDLLLSAGVGQHEQWINSIGGQREEAIKG